MTLGVFLAVLGAAALHATWNAMVKHDGDKLMAMSGVMLGHIPVALLCLPFVPIPAAESLPWMVAGMALHFGYQMFLVNSYRIGDLTQVYPIARGSAPLIVAAISIVFLGVDLAPVELLAVLVIGAGILSLGLTRRADGLRNGRAAVLALVTGTFIAGYSLVDGTGARAAGTAVGYYAWLALGNAAMLSIYLALRSPGTFRDLATHGRRVFWIGGTASFVAYAIVTWAFTQAPIALVTALRETSIVFALVIGITVLREPLNLAKVASTMTTLLGVALLRWVRS
ncbi:DMT family transporter [Jannaschia rubra]|nr:DMT family transporter [Jannaschia rubra]